MTEPELNDSRSAEIAANVSQAREEIATACMNSGRSPDEVTIVAITKKFPAADVCRLTEQGITDIGENREQEATPKSSEVKNKDIDVRWHFVGQLQRNKCKAVARFADVVQSVDRSPVVTALDRAVTSQQDDPISVLLQLSLDSDPTRGGVLAEDDEKLATDVLDCKGLRLRGVMAVGPLDWEPERAFAAVAQRSQRIRELARDADVISAGMSGDFATAISYGATVVRLGAKLLGPRADVGYPFR